MYEFMIFCIVVFLWLSSSVFSFVSYIVTHKIRKIQAFRYGEPPLLAIVIFSIILGPITGIITWISCFNSQILTKLGFTLEEKLNEWTSK